MADKLLEETELNNALNNLAVQVKYDLMTNKNINKFFFCENMFYLYDNKNLISNLNDLSKEQIKNGFFIKDKRIGVVAIDITLIKELSNSLTKDKIKDLLSLTFKEIYNNQNNLIKLTESQAFNLFEKSNLNAENYLFGMHNLDKLNYHNSERKHTKKSP